ncbi:hypothetical protein EZS27_007589 [termite gut metagenome]|uniref:DUF4270 domain-containing protein n=1 Tax=termite gut metagenome TaxID=433724 RepID=A0A5J4SFX0_9ZZZZ
MKVNYLWKLMFVLTLGGCDDTTNSLGLSMLPGSDIIIPKEKSYEVTTKSIPAEAVYAKTSMGYVGKFTDPEFGYYEAGFLTQLNCVDNFSFPSVYDDKTNPKGIMAGDSIHSITLLLYYSSYFGDSLNVCSISAYRLNKKLEENHYTDINPKDYYHPDSLLGRKSYTAVDLSVPQEERNAEDYYPNVRIPLSKEFGTEIYKLNKSNPEYFKDSQSFIENVFKGVYIENDNGDGTILYIEKVHLNIVYRGHFKDTFGNNLMKENGEDSLYYTSRTFAATQEVIQANQFKNAEEKLNKKIDETDWTYIKSPAGIFTQATLPIQQIADELEKDTINSVKLVFTHYAQNSEYEFGMQPPAELLLVRRKDLKEFFETNQLPDNVTSYFTRRNTYATNQYVFNNIRELVVTCIAEKNKAKQAAGNNWNEQTWKKETDWDKVLLVPVKINSNVDSYTQSETLVNVYHDMSPSYVKLKGGEKNKLKLDIIYSTFPNR